MDIYIDGVFYPKEEAKISVFDHGLLYGDGVFEGIRAYNGRVFRLTEHVERLYDSAKVLLLSIPISPAEMEKAIVESCKRNGLADGYIRVLVTRGVGSLGLSPDGCTKACIIIIADKIQLYPEKFYREGLKMVTASTRRNAPASLSPAVKSLNYLNNIMAKIEGAHAGAQEVLMLNEEGYVAECSGDNLFAIKKGQMVTPPIYSGALGGITRLVIFEIAEALGLPLVERQMTRYDLYVADEIFLTGTGAEVIPAVALDGRPIGDGKPGPITARVIEKFHELTRSTGTPIV